MKRGVLYIVWPGNENTEAVLSRSIESLQAIHPELPYHIERLPDGSSLLDKARMRDFSPFDSTLFLDADTIVMDRLDFGFEQSERFSIACCICECPWARRFTALSDQKDLIEYNTGVLFFQKWQKGLFESWKNASVNIDSRLPFVRNGQIAVMPRNDQASFASAVHLSGINPAVLPMNWNFRPQWHRGFFGPLKIWHDYHDVPDSFRRWQLNQLDPKHCIDFTTVG